MNDLQWCNECFRNVVKLDYFYRMLFVRIVQYVTSLEIT